MPPQTDLPLTYQADMYLLHRKIDNMLEMCIPSDKRFIILGMDEPSHLPLLEQLKKNHHALVVSEQEKKDTYIDFSTNYCTLPFAPASASCILLQHCDALKLYPRSLLREIWRILDTDGWLFVVLPSRPKFLHTHHNLRKETGYKTKQVYTMLHEHFFTVKSVEKCFHTPATIRQIPMPNHALQTRTHQVLEAGAKFFCPAFAGLLLILAQKQNVRTLQRSVSTKFKHLSPQTARESSL